MLLGQNFDLRYPRAGWSDMTDVLWLMGCRHDSSWGPYYAIPFSPGAPLGKEALCIYFFTTEIFFVVS